MSQNDDIKTLRLTMREAVRALRRPRRELEAALRLGRGNLERLMDGTMEVKVRHLLSLSKMLAIPPTDLLALGCPEAMAGATRRLTDWIAPGRQMGAVSLGAAGEPPMSRAEVAELIREEIRSAFQELKGPGGSSS